MNSTALMGIRASEDPSLNGWNDSKEFARERRIQHMDPMSMHKSCRDREKVIPTLRDRIPIENVSQAVSRLAS
jgi:hypothetical protein